MQKYLTNETVIFSARKDGKYDYEFILPEYLPNISRTVKASAHIERCTAVSDGTGTSLDIGLKISLIYISDFEGKIKNASAKYTMTIPFAESADQIEDAVIIPSAFVSAVSAKPVSQRSVSVSVCCQGCITAKAVKEFSLFESDGKDDIHTLKKSVSMCRKTTLEESEFEHSTEITLDKAAEAQTDIIYCDASFCCASCTLSDSRLDFEGKFNIHTLYETAAENGDDISSYAVVKTEITVKESIENDRISEGEVARIYLDVISCEPSVSFDPYGENRVLSISLKYKACPVIYGSAQTEIVTDAFCETCALIPEISEIPVQNIHKTIDSSYRTFLPIRCDMRDVFEITDCKMRILSVSFEQNDGKFFAAAKCAAEIFAVNQSGELYGIDGNLSIHIPVSEGEVFSPDCIPEVTLTVKSCSCSVKQGEIMCDADIGISGVILSRSTVSALSGAEPGEHEEIRRKGEIIVCYPSADDSIWSVAKKYRVNPDLVSRVNAIEGTNIKSKRIIMIP